MREQEFITMGKRIRLRRKELGLTQNKLAELLGILHFSNVSQNISDNFGLCNAEDIKLAGQIVELMVARNQGAWNVNPYPPD